VSQLNSLITVVNSGSFHWVLSLLLYFCSMSAFCVHVAGDLNQNSLVLHLGLFNYTSN